ncbi:hypothetical protein ACQCLI_09100 [Pseudomonas nitroreducens]
MTTSQRNESTTVSPLKGVWILGAVILLIGIFIALCSAIGIQNFWAGFLFLFFWAGVEQANLKRLAPTAAGAFFGLLICWAFQLLPQHFGNTAGGIAILGLVSAVVYLLIIGRLTTFINQSTMLFVTVGSIPAIQSNVSMAELFTALALGVSFFGLLAALAVWRVRTKAVPLR